MADRLTLNQLPRATLPEKMLQNSAKNGRSNYMAGTHFPLTILQDIQLNIQVAKEQRGQWQTHPNRNLYSKLKVYGLYSIMRMRAKNKLTWPEHDEGSTASNGRSLQKGPNPVRKLCVPTTNSLLQFHFHGFLISKKFDIRRISIAKNRK